MKNYFGTLNSADDHLLRDAISANNYDMHNQSNHHQFPIKLRKYSIRYYRH